MSDCILNENIIMTICSI